jgi:hypothetical protein
MFFHQQKKRKEHEEQEIDEEQCEENQKNTYNIELCCHAHVVKIMVWMTVSFATKKHDVPLFRYSLICVRTMTYILMSMNMTKIQQ